MYKNSLGNLPDNLFDYCWLVRWSDGPMVWCLMGHFTAARLTIAVSVIMTFSDCPLSLSPSHLNNKWGKITLLGCQNLSARPSIPGQARWQIEKALQIFLSCSLIIFCAGNVKKLKFLIKIGPLSFQHVSEWKLSTFFRILGVPVDHLY